MLDIHIEEYMFPLLVGSFDVCVCVRACAGSHIDRCIDDAVHNLCHGAVSKLYCYTSPYKKNLLIIQAICQKECNNSTSR